MELRWETSHVGVRSMMVWMFLLADLLGGQFLTPASFLVSRILSIDFYDKWAFSSSWLTVLSFSPVVRFSLGFFVDYDSKQERCLDGKPLRSFDE